MSEKLNSVVAVIGIDIGKNSFHLVGLYLGVAGEFARNFAWRFPRARICPRWRAQDRAYLALLDGLSAAALPAAAVRTVAARLVAAGLVATRLVAAGLVAAGLVTAAAMTRAAMACPIYLVQLTDS
jgi:hypothetical protein